MTLSDIDVYCLLSSSTTVVVFNLHNGLFLPLRIVALHGKGLVELLAQTKHNRGMAHF